MRSGFSIYHNLYESVIETFDPSLEEQGLLFKALYDYSVDGVIPDFEKTELKLAFNLLKNPIEKDRQKDEQRRLANQDNANTRWGKTNNANHANDANDANHANRGNTIQDNPSQSNTNTSQSQDKESNRDGGRNEGRDAPQAPPTMGHEDIKPPSFDEVVDYFRSQGFDKNDGDYEAQRFFNYNEGRGWRYKDGTPVHSWKALAEDFLLKRDAWN